MALTEYTVTLHHPDAEVPMQLDMSAVTEKGATARARMFAMHHTGEVEYLTCPVTVQLTSEVEGATR